jgi:hypothetical protein
LSPKTSRLRHGPEWYLPQTRPLRNYPP